MAGKYTDGTGQANMKESTPQSSVANDVRTDVPGGESKKGSQVKIDGPNNPRK